MEQPPNHSDAPRYLVTSGIFTAIALALCAARLYTKFRRTRRLDPDDYTIGVSLTFAVIGFCLATAAAAIGWGRPSIYVPYEKQVLALKVLFPMILLWILSICLVRISIALSLLRLSTNRWWKSSLYFMVFVQVCLSTGWVVIHFAWCRPLRASWEPMTEKECWPFKHQINFGWFTSSCHIVMDLIYSLMPLKLLWKLRRPLPERMLIGCLMATGLIATGVVGIKMTTFHQVGKRDPFATTYPSLLARMEELLGIIAACMPCLKSPAERMLRRLGVISAHVWSTMTRPSFVNSKAVPADVRHPEIQEIPKEIPLDDRDSDLSQPPSNTGSGPKPEVSMGESSTPKNAPKGDDAV